MATLEQKRAYRRRALAGFPVDTKFLTPEALSAYFGGSKIQCLRCGKMYRALGLHLKTAHEMEPDEYRGIYGIPWTYGLDCAETTKIRADIMRENIEDGTVMLVKDIYKKAIGAPRRARQPVRDVLTNRNLAKMNAGKDGSRQPDKRRAFMAKKGTPEFKAKMRNRPQTKNAAEFLRAYWIGREQTDDHVFNRTGFHKKPSTR